MGILTYAEGGINTYPEPTPDSALRRWRLMLKVRNGHRMAVVAVARKLVVILHAMWKGSAAFAEPAPVKAA